MRETLKRLIREYKESKFFSEQEKNNRIDFINAITKGYRVNKAFSNHLDRYINQYKKTGNVKL